MKCCLHMGLESPSEGQGCQKSSLRSIHVSRVPGSQASKQGLQQLPPRHLEQRHSDPQS